MLRRVSRRPMRRGSVGGEARVAPGLTGEVLCCEATGTRVLLDAHDVLRWLDDGGGL